MILFLGLTGFLRAKFFIVKFYCIMCLLQNNLVHYSVGYKEMKAKLHKWFNGVPQYFGGSSQITWQDVGSLEYLTS